MRKEYVNYVGDLPLGISLVNIEQYPIHWHDSIELLFVLKGRIFVTIETGKYEVEEGEVEIINCDEAHSIISDEDNEVLIFHIDPNFFERYLDDVRSIFFYTNSSEEGAQEEEKYHELRRYLAILTCEAIQKQDKYEDYIEDTTVELLYHLVNNFHQLIYEKEDLKDNEEQFERYDRIVRYIYNNYKSKISLQDIARKEFLSSDYLSHEIKNNMGYGFKDFLNLTRVEESIKLLLDTDKSISEISDELGFSHIRYFNKHFKKHYKLTPLQYRKKYKVDDDTLEKLKKFKVLNMNKILEDLTIYLEDYDRFNYEDKIIKVDIDTLANGEDFYQEFKEVISLGKAKDSLKETQKQFIINVQKDIEFKYAKIYELFSKDMRVLTGNKEFFNWSEVKILIEFLLSVNLRPFIVLDNSIEEEILVSVLENFIYYFREVYGDYELGKWKVQINTKLSYDYKETIETMIKDYFEVVEGDGSELMNNPLYDTCYMLPYIIQNSIKGNSLHFKAFDSLDSESHINNELFLGQYGILNQFGVKKPSYYAYYLLSMLGDEVIKKGEGYIVTRKNEDIQILLYSYNDDIDKLVSFEDILKRRGSKNIAERKFSLNIANLFYDYTLIKYEINEKMGSAYNYWVNFGKPERMNKDDIELLYNASFPKISLSYAKKSTVFNMTPKVEGYGATLIILNKVQKHLI